MIFQVDDPHMRIGILEQGLSRATDAIAMEKTTVASLGGHITDVTLQTNDFANEDRFADQEARLCLDRGKGSLRTLRAMEKDQLTEKLKLDGNQISFQYIVL